MLKRALGGKAFFFFWGSLLPKRERNLSIRVSGCSFFPLGAMSLLHPYENNPKIVIVSRHMNTKIIFSSTKKMPICFHPFWQPKHSPRASYSKHEAMYVVDLHKGADATRITVILLLTLELTHRRLSLSPAQAPTKSARHAFLLFL